jgi:hypothetical protein
MSFTAPRLRYTLRLHFQPTEVMEMKASATLAIVVLSLSLPCTLQAQTFGSVEPIANPAVIDTSALRDQPLRVREAFATRLLQCGIVSRVVDVLASTGAITTINDLNTRFTVGAGGFAGETNPSFVYTVIDAGPNAASLDDVKVLTDSLGYVLSQTSAFLLDADDPASLDFPANYVVVNFPAPPPLGISAAFFRAVGRIDPDLFSTDTSGYTQFGRAYLSLQSDVPNQQFIDGYTAAAGLFRLEYTPIVGGIASLFEGGAAFPGNDWMLNARGEGYLSRIPRQSHRALGRVRAFHLRVTAEVIDKLARRDHRSLDNALSFECR